MKKILVLLALFLCVIVAVPATGQERKIEGQGEEYHHAMFLNFKHSADETMALSAQLALPRELNLEIARQHVDEIGMNLENARVQHAMVHKTYDNEQIRQVMENHEALLQAHNKALAAFKIMKQELAQESPRKEVLKKQVIVVYEQSMKAANEHELGMKKLGIPEMKAP